MVNVSYAEIILLRVVSNQMRSKDISKALKYLNRILEDPFSKQSRSALKRYTGEAFILVYEKIRGLDFNMVYQCDENEHNNNYSKSPNRVLKRIFGEIDFSQKHSFIDIGCGKGYVMTKAADYPFERVGGVEYQKELCDICRKNFRILGLEDLDVYHCDAKEFDGYKDFDIIYFCNPFDETILSEVAKRIYEMHRDKPCKIYYLNPHQEERQNAIMDAGFKPIGVLRDENESYFDVRIYENKRESGEHVSL